MDTLHFFDGFRNFNLLEQDFPSLMKNTKKAIISKEFRIGATDISGIRYINICVARR